MNVIWLGILTLGIGVGVLDQIPMRPADDAVWVEGEARVRALLEEAQQARQRGAYPESLECARQAHELAQQRDDARLITETLLQLGLGHYFLNQHGPARAYLDIGLTHARRGGFELLEASLLNAQGTLEWKVGNLVQAERKFLAALAIRQRHQDWISMASLSNNLGIIDYSLRQYAGAVAHYRQGLEWLGDREDDRLRAALYSNLGESLLQLGELDEAEQHLLRSLAIEERLQDPRNLGYTYFNLGELRARKGDRAEALALYARALDLQAGIGNHWAVALIRQRTAEEHLAANQVQAALGELLQGFELAKQLNALSLLRDYSELLAEAYARADNSGLARYYGDLNQWFTQRVEAGEPEGGEPLPPRPPAARPSPDNRPKDRAISPAQAATISLLGLLIVVLVLENIRLRRRVRDRF